MGGGVVPFGLWVYTAGYNTHDVTVHPVQDPPGSLPGEIRDPGTSEEAIWHENSFKGYPFILRADAVRMVDYFDASRYGADTDTDAVQDSQDNCINVVNGPAERDRGGNVQLDTDADGYGNICDGDYDQDNWVNGFDLGIFRIAYMSGNANVDLNGDGFVNGFDLALFRDLYMNPPGPSGLAP